MTRKWIPVGALGDAFQPENKCLPPVADLAGKTVVLHFENGWTIEHCFATETVLRWRLQEGDDVTDEGQETYVATLPREGIYLVDFIKRSERATSVTLLLDFQAGVFLAVIGQLPTAEEANLAPLVRIKRQLELTAVTVTFLRGTLDAPYSDAAALPEPTRELVGKRIEYRYSETERYEHIYLNERFYTWLCLEGSEQGLTDTDACHYYRVGPELFLFVWREKLIPTLGIVVVDLRRMKTTGKIFGYDDNDTFTSLRNFGVGAWARTICALPHE